MKVTIVGATGFIGRALIARLLINPTYTVTAFSKSADTLTFDRATPENYRAIAGNLFDGPVLATALNDCDVAIYLVHMMGASHDDYAKLEADGANAFAVAAKAAGVKRIIFLGGLGDSSTALSKHLASRQRTGVILRGQLPLVIELRASMIIGHGSVAYEIIKAIGNKLPITIVPKWADTRTQPIALDDALAYLEASITVDVHEHQIIGIGGPKVLTYPQILEHYTAWSGRHHRSFVVPGIPRWAAILWLSRYTSSKSAGIGGPMVESLNFEMVVTDEKARQLFPEIEPLPIEQAFV